MDSLREAVAVLQIRPPQRTSVDLQRLATFLRRQPFFAGVDFTTLLQICTVITLHRAAPGEVVLHAEEVTDRLYLLLGGRCSVSRHSRREGFQPPAPQPLLPGQAVCEAALVVSGRASDITVTVTGEGGDAREGGGEEGEGAVLAVLTRTAWSDMCARAPIQPVCGLARTALLCCCARSLAASSPPGKRTMEQADDLEALFKRLPGLGRTPAPVLRAMSEAAALHRLPPGTILFEQHTRSNSQYVVLAGEVQVRHRQQSREWRAAVAALQQGAGAGGAAESAHGSWKAGAKGAAAAGTKAGVAAGGKGGGAAGAAKGSAAAGMRGSAAAKGSAAAAVAAEGDSGTASEASSVEKGRERSVSVREKIEEERKARVAIKESLALTRDKIREQPLEPPTPAPTLEPQLHPWLNAFYDRTARKGSSSGAPTAASTASAGPASAAPTSPGSTTAALPTKPSPPPTSLLTASPAAPGALNNWRRAVFKASHQGYTSEAAASAGAAAAAGVAATQSYGLVGGIGTISPTASLAPAVINFNLGAGLGLGLGSRPAGGGIGGLRLGMNVAQHLNMGQGRMLGQGMARKEAQEGGERAAEEADPLLQEYLRKKKEEAGHVSDMGTLLGGKGARSAYLRAIQDARGRSQGLMYEEVDEEAHLAAHHLELQGASRDCTSELLTEQDAGEPGSQEVMGAPGNAVHLGGGSNVDSAVQETAVRRQAAGHGGGRRTSVVRLMYLDPNFHLAETSVRIHDAVEKLARLDEQAEVTRGGVDSDVEGAIEPSILNTGSDIDAPGHHCIQGQDGKEASSQADKQDPGSPRALAIDGHSLQEPGEASEADLERLYGSVTDVVQAGQVAGELPESALARAAGMGGGATAARGAAARLRRTVTAVAAGPSGADVLVVALSALRRGHAAVRDDMISERLAALTALEPLRGLSDEHQTQVALGCKLLCLDANQLIVRQGQQVEAMYVVMDGEVRLLDDPDCNAATPAAAVSCSGNAGGSPTGPAAGNTLSMVSFRSMSLDRPALTAAAAGGGGSSGGGSSSSSCGGGIAGGSSGARRGVASLPALSLLGPGGSFGESVLGYPEDVAAAAAAAEEQEPDEEETEENQEEGDGGYALGVNRTQYGSKGRQVGRSSPSRGPSLPPPCRHVASAVTSRPCKVLILPRMLLASFEYLCGSLPTFAALRRETVMGRRQQLKNSLQQQANNTPGMGPAYSPPGLGAPPAMTLATSVSAPPAQPGSRNGTGAGESAHGGSGGGGGGAGGGGLNRCPSMPLPRPPPPRPVEFLEQVGIKTVSNPRTAALLGNAAPSGAGSCSPRERRLSGACAVTSHLPAAYTGLASAPVPGAERVRRVGMLGGYSAPNLLPSGGRSHTLRQLLEDSEQLDDDPEDQDTGEAGPGDSPPPHSVGILPHGDDMTGPHEEADLPTYERDDLDPPPYAPTDEYWNGVGMVGAMGGAGTGGGAGAVAAVSVAAVPPRSRMQRVSTGGNDGSGGIAGGMGGLGYGGRTVHGGAAQRGANWTNRKSLPDLPSINNNAAIIGAAAGVSDPGSPALLSGVSPVGTYAAASASAAGATSSSNAPFMTRIGSLERRNHSPFRPPPLLSIRSFGHEDGPMPGGGAVVIGGGGDNDPSGVVNVSPQSAPVYSQPATPPSAVAATTSAIPTSRSGGSGGFVPLPALPSAAASSSGVASPLTRRMLGGTSLNGTAGGLAARISGYGGGVGASQPSSATASAPNSGTLSRVRASYAGGNVASYTGYGNGSSGVGGGGGGFSSEGPSAWESGAAATATAAGGGSGWVGAGGGGATGNNIGSPSPRTRRTSFAQSVNPGQPMGEYILYSGSGSQRSLLGMSTTSGMVAGDGDAGGGGAAASMLQPRTSWDGIAARNQAARSGVGATVAAQSASQVMSYPRTPEAYR
ncbi:hypothetical protein Agub_g5325 [Astrephomene gubernaculifera]|uniref:Cyclic nucleotide-binding domain-containing protein n=1 Tax=Astrephomene gubernaculifera TaxID=47775 RepID=A0AAD3DPD7_9CHLO|nr:hypothetical protein Agub_g5325 [Astrephomene gubernaculifera]